ncbi:MAG: RpiB/LacA/LacB family sugar-phosphate isomerase [Clostridia bacterium]|nr:RpiB/LacA/LacB family sugar-phosphate isomerase [Clostridia bacterium]
MKIGLINENSQASKNSIIYDSLKKICDKKGYELYNYGMENAEENNLTYVQAGLLAAILINSKAVDFIVTGCGTGEGAMLALNSFPNVLCGHIVDPTDAYLFSQINAGNAIALGFAKGFGWGSELTLDYIFEKLFETEFGGGYPKERVIPEQTNKKILDEVKKVTHRDMIEILKNIDQQFLYETVNRDQFKKYFFETAEDEEIKEYIKKILQK